MESDIIELHISMHKGDVCGQYDTISRDKVNSIVEKDTHKKMTDNI